MQDVQTLEELGYRLGRRREEHGATLEHCARSLHIRAKYLASMEAGRFGDIPGEAYAKGYLQNYAGFLGFNRAEIVAAFDRIHDASVAAARSFYLPEVLTKENKPSKGLAIASFVAAVVFYGVWSFTQRSAPVAVAPFSGTARMLTVADIRGLTESKSATLSDSHPCAKTEPSVFPPCYGSARLPPLPLFLPSRMTSVMELSSHLGVVP